MKFTSFSIEVVARFRELSAAARTGRFALDLSRISIELPLVAGPTKTGTMALDLKAESIGWSHGLRHQARAWGDPRDDLHQRAREPGSDGQTTNLLDRALATLADRLSYFWRHQRLSC